MDRNFELMARDQVEVDHLAASTAKTLAEIHVLSEQTDVILAALKVIDSSPKGRGLSLARSPTH